MPHFFDFQDLPVVTGCQGRDAPRSVYQQRSRALGSRQWMQAIPRTRFALSPLRSRSEYA